MEGNSPNETESKLCQLCKSQPSKYACPRCFIAYCSVNCYKSEVHLDCSESFYKKCVEDELHAYHKDSNDRKKMLDILQRFHTEGLADPLDDFDSDEDLLDNLEDFVDSDDDDEVPDLAERVKNVDLNNADDLWTVLTDAERQEFEAIIRNGDESKLLPQWSPWWAQTVTEKLVEELDKPEVECFKNNCPNIVQIAPIAAVENASPLVQFNLVNILCAYALTVLHYNGEHDSSSAEAVGTFLELNDVIGGDKNFSGLNPAISSVVEKAITYQLALEDSESPLADALKQIVRGPSKKYQSFYMTAALSDLHGLFSKVRDIFTDVKCPESSAGFPKKLTSQINSRFSKLSKKHLALYTKKIEYYIAWIDKFGESMLDLNI